jgi:hypothetical protein
LSLSIRARRVALHTALADVNVREQRRQQFAAHDAVTGVPGLNEA